MMLAAAIANIGPTVTAKRGIFLAEYSPITVQKTATKTCGKGIFRFDKANIVIESAIVIRKGQKLLLWKSGGRYSIVWLTRYLFPRKPNPVDHIPNPSGFKRVTPTDVIPARSNGLIVCQSVCRVSNSPEMKQNHKANPAKKAPWKFTHKSIMIGKIYQALIFPFLNLSSPNIHNAVKNIVKIWGLANQ